MLSTWTQQTQHSHEASGPGGHGLGFWTVRKQEKLTWSPSPISLPHWSMDGSNNPCTMGQNGWKRSVFCLTRDAAPYTLQDWSHSEGSFFRSPGGLGWADTRSGSQSSRRPTLASPSMVLGCFQWGLNALCLEQGLGIQECCHGGADTEGDGLVHVGN